MTITRETRAFLAIEATAITLLLIALMGTAAAETSGGCWDGTGAVAHWTFNDTTSPPFTDICQGNDAYNYSGNIDSVAGQFSNAGNFSSGDTEFVTLPRRAYYDFDWDENYTTCFWFNPTTVSPGTGLYIFHGAGSGRYWLVVTHHTNNSIRLLKYDALVLTSFYSTRTVDAGAWTHICAAVDTAADKIILWLNGTQEGNTTDLSSALTTSGTNITVGKKTGGTNYVDATLDELFIYNYTLDVTEVNSLYQYNNISGLPAPPPGAVGCSVTANDFNITNGSIGGNAWTNRNGSVGYALVANYSVTCYPTASYHCDIQRNGTLVGRNATSLANGSFNYIATNATWAEAPSLYLANITCTNGTFTNTTTTTTIRVDSISPTINLTYPTNTTYPDGTLVTLNFTYTEVNPNTCKWSLDSGANSTINYVNGTTVTQAIGTYHLEVWCSDDTLNSVYEDVYFKIEGQANATLYEATPYLATYGMPREFRANYSTAQGFLGGEVYPEAGNWTWDLTPGDRILADWINDTHMATWRTASLAIRWWNGTLVDVHALADGGDLANGLFCRDPDYCYILWVKRTGASRYNRLEQVWLNNGTQTQVASFTEASRGYQCRGLAKHDNQWWTSCSPTAIYSPSNLTILNNDATMSEVLVTDQLASASHFWDSGDDNYFYLIGDISGLVANVSVRSKVDGSYQSSFILNATYNINTPEAFWINGNRVQLALFGDPLAGVHPFFDIAAIQGIPNASCNLTYGSSTFAMTDVGFYHTVTVIENNSDHETNFATVNCTSPDYESKGASLGVETNNWHRPIGAEQDIPFTVLADYTDVNDIHVQRFGNLTGLLHCVRINTEGNSLETSDDLDLWVYQETYFSGYGINVLELTLRAKTSGRPGDAVATCNVTLPGIIFEEQWFNCTTNPTETITINTDYFVCSNQTFMGVVVGTTDTSHQYINGTWSVVNVGNALTLVTENTNKSVLSNVTDNFIEGIIWDCADPTRRLVGIHVNVTQQNESGRPNIKNDVTDANGIFGIGDLWLDRLAQITYTDPTNEYESITGAFTLTQAYPGRNLSICMGLPVAPVGIKTAWKLYDNVTDAFETIETFTQWKPNETYKKDSLLLTIKAFVENENGDPQTGMDFASSTISTDCSFSTTPTSYFLVEEGNGFYNLIALIGAANESNLYAFCAEGDSFEITYRAPGILQNTRVDFKAFQMRVTGATLLVDQLVSYNWALATALFYYNKADQMNKPVSSENLQCQARLENSSGSNITAWTAMNTTGNKVIGNFTSLDQTPSVVHIRWNCTASGFDRFEELTFVNIGTDAVTSIDCWIQSQTGERLEWTTIGDQLQHFCQLQTYANASLRTLQVKSTNENFNRERIFSYSSDTTNLWTFATPLLTDDMPKGLHLWNLGYDNQPTGLSLPDFSYYQFTKVYSVPPKKISPDYCNSENCPKTLWKGDSYRCQVTTKFEAEYTKIIAGIKLNHSNTKIMVPHSDVFNAQTGIHTTSIFINGIGETGQYGIFGDTTIQCHLELYIDNERLVYGTNPTDMNTHFKSEYVNDMLGLSGFINGFFASDDPMGYAFNAMTNFPGQAVTRMGVFDETCMAVQGSSDPIGCIRPLIALLYLIAFALLLVVGFVVTVQVLERRRK